MRIFTTDRELPFAGHPTLGTAWVLGRGRAEYTLQMAAGRVGVTFGPDGVAWMEPPPVALGESLDGSRAAALLGLSEDRIIIDIPSRYATVGPWFAMIGVSDLGALREIRVNRDVYDELSGGNYLYPFVFAPEGYSEDADFAARMLMVTEGGEDAATGSANTALAACLREVGREGRFIVEQGFEIGRPSRIYLDVGDAIRVGGKVRPVLTGEFRLPVGP